MKLSGREALAFCAAPDERLFGALIHGSDASQVVSARRQISAGILGEDLDPMRIEELPAATVRKDAAALDAAMKARGFFSGRPVVIVTGSTDGMAQTVASVMESTTAEDAFLLLTADALPARSALRKLFEGSKSLISLHLFPEAPDRSDIDAMLRRAGAAGADHDALEILAEHAGSMDHGSFRNLVEVVALNALGSGNPVDAATVLSLVPSGRDAEIDAAVAAIAEGRPDEAIAVLTRLKSGGATPVSILIALQRHFRTLLTVRSARGGIETALDRVRPPLWRNHKSAMRAQLRRWNAARLEQANKVLFETDARVRSSSQAPDMALLERCALRLAMMARG